MTVSIKSLASRVAARLRRNRRHAGFLRESTEFRHVGTPGPVIELFNQIKSIPGWFNVDDCAHFLLLLRYQYLSGMRGDVLEIGSYHGRSTAVLAHSLAEDERLVVCDAFETETDDAYAERPSPERLAANVQRVVPGFPANCLEVHACLSNDLSLAPERRFRFIHVDGGHSREQAAFDLTLCSRHTSKGSVVVVDDYRHPDWPGVTEASDGFLRSHPEFRRLGDMNRHGALGRKLYLLRMDD